MNPEDVIEAAMQMQREEWAAIERNRIRQSGQGELWWDADLIASDAQARAVEVNRHNRMIAYILGDD